MAPCKTKCDKSFRILKKGLIPVLRVTEEENGGKLQPLPSFIITLIHMRKGNLWSCS